MNEKLGQKLIQLFCKFGIDRVSSELLVNLVAYMGYTPDIKTSRKIEIVCGPKSKDSSESHEHCINLYKNQTEAATICKPINEKVVDFDIYDKRGELAPTSIKLFDIGEKNEIKSFMNKVYSRNDHITQKAPARVPLLLLDLLICRCRRRRVFSRLRQALP